MTTTKRERIEQHERWHWTFGDGTERVVEGADRYEMTAAHDFPGPGEYTVTARSLTADDRRLVERRWDVTVEPDAGPDQHRYEFDARSVPPVGVDLRLAGPVAWRVDAPARYDVRLDLDLPEEIIQADLWYHPARSFDVRWAKPGIFSVRAAVTLRLIAEVDGDRVLLWQTHIVEEDVEVMATTVLD